ncbi:hypothetical protein GH741_17635 [Aquibacillus halophilus]|uniref:Copper resistance protein CopC n=1 Tax=Aquibacillus halophilus TaxID=930132 RepID=A0A6A8DL43_9BACI|nr:copper resistance protein CopC [Aquibacillus halophilus]MRH44469.1 hypothetical protein [Aquibacillus halophilus]
MIRKNLKTITMMLAFLTILISVVILSSTIAVAHSSMKETSPRGNTTLDKSPSTIEIWFQDPVVIHADSIKVLGINGNELPTGKTQLDPNDAGHVISRLGQELAPGKYKVKINVVAQDGFVIEEEFSFSINKSEQAEIEELTLEKSNISDGKILQESPKQIELWFNQPAEVTAFGIFDDNYRPVTTELPVIDSENPKHIVIPLTERLSSGTHQITWYASPITQSTTPIQSDRVGVFYFAVDEFSSMTPIGNNRQAIDTSTFDFSLGLKQVAYWFTFIGYSVIFGVAWFDFIILKKHMKKPQRYRLLGLFSLLSLIGTILLIIDHRQDLSGLSAKNFVSIKFVWIPLVQLLLVSIGIGIKKIRPLLFGLALILWPFIIGHASYPRYGGYLTMIIAAIHVLAVGIWMGGLVALIAKPKFQDSKQWFKSIGPSFSRWAFVSVLLIVFSGTWMTVEFLPSYSFQSLIESEWGRSLLIKILMFLVIVTLGFFQRKAIKKMSSEYTHSFFKRVRTEIIYGMIILFLAASLVAANPSAAEQGVYRETTKQELDLNVKISPLEMGLNTITLKFENNLKITNVKVELSMPPNWRIENNAFRVNENTYKLTGNLLHASGTINMKVKVMMANGKEILIPYRVVVPGEVRFNE